MSHQPDSTMHRLLEQGGETTESSVSSGSAATPPQADDTSSGAAATEPNVAPPSPACPRTCLQHGIHKPKIYTDGTVRYGCLTSSGEPQFGGKL